jgi:hypothetical protein
VVSLVGIVHTTMAVPSLITIKFSILLIILLAFEARETIAIGFSNVTVTKVRKAIPIASGKVTVWILNKVYAPYPTNPTSLNVHCKSKDNDLGLWTLNFGKIRHFSFKPQFIPFSPTLFNCSFTWPQNPRVYYHAVYDQRYDRCYDCTWEIYGNGACLNQNCRPW